MSHRIPIFEGLSAPLQNQEVREHFTPAQCTKVDQILAAGEPACSDHEFRYLQRRLAQAFCQED
jgi:hypothetical protein